MSKTFLENFCDLFGVNFEDLQELNDQLKQLTNESKDNPMNPGCATDEEMKSDGWVLKEDYEEREDGCVCRRRTWIKQDDIPAKPIEDNCDCCKENTIHKENEKINIWMGVLNSGLIHNWNWSNFNESNTDEWKTVLMIIKHILDHDYYGKKATDLWSEYPCEDPYVVAGMIDKFVLKMMDNIEKVLEDIRKTADLHEFKNDASYQTLLNRLSKLHDYIMIELKDVIKSAEQIDVDYIGATRDILDIGLLEAPNYNMLYLWHSMYAQYLSDYKDMVLKTIQSLELND